MTTIRSALLALLVTASTATAVFALDTAEPHIVKGDALMGKMKLDEATNEFREAVRLEPENAKAHQRLGAVLAAKDDYETAIMEEKQAIKLDGKFFLPHVILGQIYLNQGKVPDSIAEFKQAVAKKPTSF